MIFNGFISYSHAADGRLAPAVQRGLHRLAKPWHRRRALWIFRDQTGLSVTPALWKSIQDAMDGSDYFVLMASPEAAQSPWVNREITHWTETKPTDRILPVLTDGEWEWDRYTRDFTPESTAVPLALRGVFTEEPLYLDLRWARDAEQLDLHHSRFRDAIAQLAAPMHGVSKDELNGEDVRQHRRARRLQLGAVATLVVLTLLASAAGLLAVRNAAQATRLAQEALHSQQVADEQRGSARKFASEAQQQQAVAEEQQAKAAKAGAEARKQQTLADQAAAEAAYQQHEADQQKKNARQQQKLASLAAKQTREQQQLATESAARAAQAATEAQQATAKAQTATTEAKKQQKVAETAAAEAKKQQALADKQERLAISRRLLNQARSAVDNDPSTALRLGAAAQAIQPETVIKSEFAGVVASTHFVSSIENAYAVAAGPNGLLVTTDAAGFSLWDVSNRAKPVRTSTFIDSWAFGTPMLLSPDGRTLVYITAQYHVAVYDVSSKAHPVRLDEMPAATGASALAFSPAGNLFAIGQWDGKVTLWNFADPAHPRQRGMLFSGYQQRILKMTISFDGRTLAMMKRGTVDTVWDITDPAAPEEFPSPVMQSATALAFHSKAPILAGGLDGGVTLWDAHLLNGALTRPPKAPVAPTTDAATEPATETSTDPEPSTSAEPPAQAPSPPAVAATPDPTPAPTPTYDGQLGRVTGLGQSVQVIAFSPDGSRMAAGDTDGNVLVWDSRNVGTPRLVIKLKIYGELLSAAFTDNGQTLVTADQSGRVSLWDVGSNGIQDQAGTLRQSSDIVGTAFSPDRRTLAVADYDGTADFYDMTDTGNPERTAEDVSLHGGKTLGAVAFSSDLRMAAGAGDGQVTLTDVRDPARPVTLAVLDVENVFDIAFSPDHSILATAGNARGLQLWDLADPRKPRLFGTASGSSGSLAFSPDGRTIAVADGPRGVSLWKLAGRSDPIKVSATDGHSTAVQRSAFSPDGRTLATASGDGTVILWDVADLANPHRLGTLTPDGTPVWTLAFSADGRTVATGSGTDSRRGGADSTAVIWDVADRAGPIRLATLRTTYGSQTSPVTFNADGHTLLSGGTVWDYRQLNDLRADPAKYACAITGRGLNRSEWSAFVPELPYRDTCTADVPGAVRE